MKTIETTVYEFDELSDSAKDKARDWYRNGALYYEWWDSTYEDAESVGLKITGFDLDRNRHCTGSLKTSGTLCAARIHKEHGPSCETFKTATAFLADLAKLNAEIAAVDGDDETNCEYEEWQDKRTELETEFEKSLLEDYSILLQHQCEYLLSDDQANESIVANGYTFTEEGKRF